MSNQIFSNDNNVYDFLKKEWSIVTMLTPIDSNGYQSSDLLINSNYTVEGSWCQV